MSNSEKVQNYTNKVSAFLKDGFRPEIGLVLGTGLGALAEEVEEPVRVPYSALSDYPRSTVSSHAGSFVCGFIGGRPVIMQEGRCHLYENYSPEEVVLGVRVMAELGASSLVLTNAAGALNPQFVPGEVMLITDHINFTGKSPLTGVRDVPGRSRFTDMTRVYDQELRTLAENTALALGTPLEKGVYLGLQGPQMETPAETRMFRSWGADAVGMSTVMEAIAARHLGVRVLGFSCLSNINLPDCMARASIEEIIRVSGQAAAKLQTIISAVIPCI